MTTNYNAETYEYSHINHVKIHRKNMSSTPEITILRREANKNLASYSSTIELERENELFYKKIKIYSVQEIKSSENRRLFLLLQNYIQTPNDQIIAFSKIWSQMGKCYLSNNKNCCFQFISSNSTKSIQRGRIEHLFQVNNNYIIIYSHLKILNPTQLTNSVLQKVIKTNKNKK